MASALTVSDLAGCFAGDLARFAGSLRVDDGAPHLEGPRLLELATLRELIERFGATQPGGEPRAVVSMWSQWHFSNTVVPATVAQLLAGIALPLTLQEGRFALHDNGCTAGIVVPPDRPLAPCRAEAGFEALIEGHLSPLIALLAAHFGVAAKLLWNNAAVSLAWSVQQCAADPRVDREGLLAAQALLTSVLTPAGRKNPLDGALRPSALAPMEGCQRKICCLRYLLPGMADCGSFCPLPRHARAAAA
ncbi:MAG: siderophore-iron reductase FhuF [Bosea sp. (in: a-proteobacteria)]|uniref:siderophore-iron reductase FhuF n=1 Tax=Bosea sp. (in: a-proteobacteria) TaxID=1871050 RepID=UPI0027367B9E|nr:siderophore-iron reductase FhuF [Bosea sp. (in: a-proteobacteria)]MDP3256140.1 siderophore-iron reductase FhuF [Bosea sp. (in: a-proteobacteria)]MDP3317770.1 siderophore-iron reductase FhuF [Bosea sp. (in: a-proteobacteria)]